MRIEKASLANDISFEKVNKPRFWPQTSILVKPFLTILLSIFSGCVSGSSQPIVQSHFVNHVETSDSIENIDSVSIRIFKELKLSKIIQSKSSLNIDTNSVYEPAINSPKSVVFTKDGSKFYINSLEGYTTVVFDSKTFKKIKEIRHEFNESNNHLFKNNEHTLFDYSYKQNRAEYNCFLGKPVESCLSHDGKYLWVTYYRRDWDPKAESPSALAIIDTDNDEIIRVMPTGPLPKMIACSHDNQYVVVTHWGDNTISLIDIKNEDPKDFYYVSHIAIDKRLNMNFSSYSNRDSECGNCLRGTVFTPDNKYILIAKMGGNGIAVVDLKLMEYVGTITGSNLNIRHLVIKNEELFLSSNKYGTVQKAGLREIFEQGLDEKKLFTYRGWKSINIGSGVRTIEVSDDGKYIFACVNNDSKIVVIDALTMQLISKIDAAKFPVGLALSPDGNQLITTSQGKDGIPNSGNTVMIFDVIYND